MIQHFCEWLQSTAFATAISETYFPVVESVHVIAISLVAGTIFIVDLRLVGLASRHLRYTQLADQVLPWTWRAYALAAVCGSMLFSANATTYYTNVPFRMKMTAMLLAGLNMAYFQFVTFRSVATWDAGRPSSAARFAGAASLLLWTTVIACGRWTGFV